MRSSARINSIGILSLLVIALIAPASEASAQDNALSTKVENRALAIRTALDRSLQLLSQEVPNWISENHCASCHNQGDAAIALIEGSKRKLVDATSLQSTLAWLTQPKKWSSNRGLPEANDQQLANLQFAGALLSAYELDHAKYQPALDDAATLLAADQATDGSWEIVSGGSLASPITHGEILLTGTAVKVLHASGIADKNKHIAQGKTWLASQKPRNTLQAAALMIALAKDAPNRETLHDECVGMILDAQEDRSGGWGPHRNAAPEAFDTALAILALSLANTDAADVSKSIECGVDYLIVEQSADGSWPETTRPSNTPSYAHRISTTAWACRALMAASVPRIK